MKFVDLFAGIGGFHQALKSCGEEFVWASEWDRWAQKTYQANYDYQPGGDITKIKAADIPAMDIVCAGFPCQAFSISGKKLGFEDTRGTLFFDVARIVEYHRPKVVFLENVKNFATHDSGKTLQVVKRTLEDLNYDVFYRVLNASDFGLPTARQRIYILAFERELKVDFEFPVGNKKSCLADFLDSKADQGLYIQRSDISYSVPQLQADEQGFYAQKPIRIGSIGSGRQGERIYDPRGHAITFSAHGGGPAAKVGAYLIDGKVRKLSVAEAARVMGFENMIFPVSDSQACQQIGNSVAVNVIKAIWQQVQSQLPSA